MGWFRKKTQPPTPEPQQTATPEWIQWGDLEGQLSQEEQAQITQYLQVSLSTMGQPDPWVPMLITDSGMNALEFLLGHDPSTVLASVTDMLQKNPPASRFAFLCIKAMVGEQGDDPAILAFVQGKGMSKTVLLAGPLEFVPEQSPAAALREPIRPMAEAESMIRTD